MKSRFIFPAAAAVVALALALGIYACSERSDTPAGPVTDLQFSAAQDGDPAEAILAIMDAVNAKLEAAGADYRVAMAEYVTGGGDQAGAEVISSYVGNKQLEHDFVPFDTRRTAWSGSTGGPDDDITYAVDQTSDAVPPLGGLGASQTTAAINAAMATWDGVSCSTLPITMNPDYGLDIGVIAWMFGLGGSSYILADIQHAGWGDIDFDPGVLGATFTFIWVDEVGEPTDIDNNGKYDVAFREIYYDPSWNWKDDGSPPPNYDVETVALHEVGHGLSQAHFGTTFVIRGSVVAAPRAIMNPYIFGVDRSLLASDDGGHCSIWAEWPHN